MNYDELIETVDRVSQHNEIIIAGHLYAKVYMLYAGVEDEIGRINIYNFGEMQAVLTENKEYISCKQKYSQIYEGATLVATQMYN